MVTRNLKMWKTACLVLLVALFAQYAYYGIQQMMYQESVAALYKKTSDLDAIKVDVLLLQEKLAELESNDRKLVALIDANRKEVWRSLDEIEQRLPPVKPIKKVN